MTDPNDLFEYFPIDKEITIPDLYKKSRELLALNRELMMSDRAYSPLLALAALKATDGIWDYGEDWWPVDMSPDQIEHAYNQILLAIKSVQYIKDHCEGPLRSVKLTSDNNNGFCDLVDGLVESGYDGQFFLLCLVDNNVLITEKTMTYEEITRFFRAFAYARQFDNGCMGYFVYLRPGVDEDYKSYIELTYS